MYRLSYKDPCEGRWIVVSISRSLKHIYEIWSTIFWSAAENPDYDDTDEFLRIEDLSTGKRL